MSETKRIVVLISGSGTNLQALIDTVHKSGAAEIAGVISNTETAYGLQRAKEAGISAQALNHKAFESRAAFDNELRQRIDEYQPDLVVLAGFMRILTPEFVQHYKGRMLNIHPSLLPKYQGLNTHQRVLDAGDTVHGVTVHFVTEELDGGPSVLQAQVPVLTGDTAEILANRVHVQEHLIYPEVVRWFCDDRLELRDEGAFLDGKALSTSGIIVNNATV